MNGLVRWGKFNLVGAVGTVVQLVALAGLNRLLPRHYLCATGVAIEITLLHNFFWHLHFTWRGRRWRSSAIVRLIRFQASNGAISLTGNLAMMRLLVQQLHQPLLIANAMAIVCCSVVNFRLGNSWAFAALRESNGQDTREV
ncbi:MAG TPA: GtrA family protein [Acidobacteriaceae bacterium]|nr:GtrA family protein [Acidobacteriaceae bacterium]